LTSIGNGVDYYAQNFKELEPWENAIDNGDLPVYKGYRLSDDDMLRQFVIMELMSNFSLNIKRVEEEFKINFKEYFDDAIKALKEFEDAQLLKITDNKIEVSQTGSMLIRNICMPFDAYLNKIPEEKRRFSKTI
ncbi:coproporphyrinogen III oxidase, partial [Aliarcobacter butzleri]